jgi:hypothetical protein
MKTLMLFGTLCGLAMGLQAVRAESPPPPAPSKTSIPVVAGAAGAQAALDKALASGQALVADLTRSDNKNVPARCPLVRSKTELPPGRYRLHALVATTPQDNIISEAVTLFVLIRGSYRAFEPKEWFPQPGKLAPVHFDFMVDKPGQVEVCLDWLVGESKLDMNGYGGQKGPAIQAYHGQRQNFINQLELKDGPGMSMNEAAPEAAVLGEALDDQGEEKRLASRPRAAADLPANRMLLTGLAIERLSPVEVVAVRTEPVAFEPGATGRALADVRNLDAKPATAKLAWTVEDAKHPGEILARHEETVTLAAGEQRTVAMAEPLATAGITRLGRVRVETVVEGLRSDACRTSFVVLPPKRAAPTERPKKVFAHYMGCYPAGTGVTSLHLFEDSASMLHESKDPVAAIGGRFRNFPLVWQEPGLMKGKNGGWPLTAEEGADLEIRRAMRIGIDGFAVDAWAGGNDAIRSFETLIKVAAEKNYPFEITLCLDNADPVSTVKWLLKNHGKNPKLARRDGKPMVFDYGSAFRANAVLQANIDERIPESGRAAAVARMRRTELGWHLMGQAYREYEELIGEPIFFSFDLCWLFFQVPDVKPDMPVRAAAAIARHVPLLWSFSTFGFPGNADEISKAVREAGAEWGGAASYHQKENYCSGANFEVFMPQGTEWLFWSWNDLRRQEATCLQLVTWNDYTENTNIGPAYNTRYGIYELTGHQIQKWRTGKEPVPDHDQVYVIYPKYPKNAKIWPFRGQGGNRAIEIKTILTAPATIRLPGRTIEYEAKAGMDWISDDWENKDWNKESQAIRAKDKFCRAQGFRQFPVTPGPVIVEVVREGKVVLRVESPEPITDRPFRQDCGAVCWSSEEERNWKADFGDKPMFVYSEYGDADKDGLPNWFEMYWFSKERNFKPAETDDAETLVNGPAEHPVTRWLDLSTQTLVDPKADPDADGKSNLQEYLDRTDPTAAPAPTAKDLSTDLGFRLE